MADETFDPFGDQQRTADREKQSERDKLKRENELADVLFVMNDPAGRRYIHRLLSNAGLFRLSYEKGDPYQTAFNEGARNNGLRMTADIMEIAAAQYAQMIEENKHAHQ